MSGTRSAQTVRDELMATRVFAPDSPKIELLVAELAILNRAERERRDGRKAVYAGILTATHVLLADGWVEVIRIDAPAHVAVVANGGNRDERVPISKILEVKAL